MKLLDVLYGMDFPALPEVLVGFQYDDHTNF